jgi:Ca-activated chloride channel family protein
VALALLLLASGFAHAGQAQLTVAVGQPLLPADKKNVTYLKVGLTGFTLTGREERAPANVALVLDKSGSMSGEKLQHAKDAALAALDRLGSNDIVSIIVYDTTVSVLVPATKFTDREAVRAKIRSIEADGTTALFAGVSKAAEEIRKFSDHERANRIILLSDGQANVGPSLPSDLGDLGHSLRKEGIAVSTIGLGLDYNEDLMCQLARRSDGNHCFVRDSSELEKIFAAEFGDVAAVVAQELSVKIHCADGIRPVRLLGRDGEITGQNVYVQLSQLCSRQEKFVVLEVEVPATDAGKSREVATVSATYANMATKTTDKLSASDGKDALALFAKEQPDFVCLDIMMPGMNGYDVCRALRRSTPAVPIIFISAKSEEIDRVIGLELGADDFIVKPFGVKEVIARIRAVTRRCLAARAQSQGDGVGRTAVFALGDLTVFPAELRARRGGVTIELNVRDLKLLALFAKNKGNVLDRGTLYNHGWGYDFVPNSRTLDQYVSQLRKRIERDPQNPAIIKTVHGVGYRYDG